MNLKLKIDRATIDVRHVQSTPESIKSMEGAVRFLHYYFTIF